MISPIIISLDMEYNKAIKFEELLDPSYRKAFHRELRSFRIS